MASLTKAARFRGASRATSASDKAPSGDQPSLRDSAAGPRAVPAPQRSLLVTVLFCLTAVYLAGAVLAAFFGVLSLDRADVAEVATLSLSERQIACVAAAVAFVAIVTAAWIASWLGWRSGAWAVLLATFAAQLAWSGALTPQPLGDLAGLWEDARRFAAGLRAGAPEWGVVEASPAPSALAFYGVVIAVVSDDLSVLRVLCAALWTGQTWLVWRIARLISETRRTAALSAALYGLSPSLAVFGGLPSVEAVFGLAALGAVYCLLSYRRRGLVRSAALSGFLIGLAIMARPLGIGHAAGLTLTMLLALIYLGGWRPKWRMVQALAFFWIGLAAALAPLIGAPALRGDADALRTPTFGLGYELFVGTDPAGGGAYLEAETQRALNDIGYFNALQRSPDAADRLALDAALARLSEAPVAAAILAATEKMGRIWGGQPRLVRWSQGPGGGPSSATAQIFNLAPAVLSGAFAALLAAAAIGAVRMTARGAASQDPTRWALALTTLLAVVLTAALIEAQARNAFAMTPFLALLAPLAAARLPRATAQAHPRRRAPVSRSNRPAKGLAAATPAVAQAQRQKEATGVEETSAGPEPIPGPEPRPDLGPEPRPSPSRPAKPAKAPRFGAVAAATAAQRRDDAVDVEPPRGADDAVTPTASEVEPGAEATLARLDDADPASTDVEIETTAAPEDKIARVLAGMSKPPRRGSNDDSA